MNRVRIAAGSAVIGALALSACGPNQLGAAALVEDERITISEVQGTLSDVQELRERFGLPTELGPEAARQEIERRVLVLVFEQAARDLNITVTPGDIAAARDGDDRSPEEIAQLAAENNVSLESLDDLYRQVTIEQKLAERISRLNPGASEEEIAQAYGERLVATASSMDITINPRYGRFDPAEGSITDVTAGFLREAES